MKRLELTAVVFSIVLAACSGGTIGAGDGFPPDSAPDAPDEACDGVECPAGQRCQDGVCYAFDACADIVCANPGELCDPRSGECVAGGSDADHDGVTVGDGDCHDGDPAIHPGAVEDCDGLDDDCDEIVDDGLEPRECTTECTTGEETCTGGRWTCSVPDTCECLAGATETRACGTCGTERRTCQADYTWSTWGACEGQGPCAPGATQACSACSLSGTQTCSGSCAWGACQVSGCCSDGECGSDQRCFGGQCSDFCHRTDGTQTCATVCSWAGMTCTGAIVYDTGERSTCGVEDVRMDCYGI